jgi:NAD(P)-dependent dehydrogenase (short-subunit alcohol dehydrogenase family)
MKKNEETILITGGAKRLGLLLAKKSLELGYKVIIHYHSDSYNAPSELESYCKKGLVCFIQHDLNNDPSELILKAKETGNTIVGLVNNASVFYKSNLLDLNSFNTVCKTNFTAPLYLSEKFYKEFGRGWIINITDANIHSLNVNYQNYRISKLFLEELTRQLAITFAPAIRVNAIAPGAMLPSADEPEYYKKLAELIPLGFNNHLESFLETFSYLIKSEYVTGQIIKVDGGFSLISG